MSFKRKIFIVVKHTVEDIKEDAFKSLEKT